MTARVLRLPLLPSQQMTLGWRLHNPHHYSVYFTADLPLGTSASQALLAAGALSRRHEALRLRLFETSGGMAQHLLPEDDETNLRFHEADVSGAAPEEQDARMAQMAQHRAAETDLFAGPWSHVIYFHRGDRPPRVLFVIHHLACDLVSSWILEKEFVRLVSDPGFAAKPAASFAGFAHGLPDVVHSVEDEGDYWRERAAVPVPTLKPDHVGPNEMRSAAQVLRWVAPEDVARLMRGTSNTSGARMADVLLCAAGRAQSRLTGSPHCRVTFANQTRDLVSGGVSAARLVGYVASFFPFTFSAPAALPAAEAIASTRRQFDAIPAAGRHGALLAALHPDAAVRDALAVPSDIVLNYWGLNPSQQGLSGGSTAPENRRFFLLGITPRRYADGRLQVKFSFCRDTFDPSTIERHADVYGQELQALAAALV